MKCTFCSNEILPGRGKMLVKNDGTVSVYCNSKCERNAKIRNPRAVKWTETYRKAKAGSAKAAPAQEKGKGGK